MKTFPKGLYSFKRTDAKIEIHVDGEDGEGVMLSKVMPGACFTDDICSSDVFMKVVGMNRIHAVHLNTGNLVEFNDPTPNDLIVYPVTVKIHAQRQ